VAKRYFGVIADKYGNNIATLTPAPTTTPLAAGTVVNTGYRMSYRLVSVLIYQPLARDPAVSQLLRTLRGSVGSMYDSCCMYD
jgi:hypothetical protein